MNYSNPLEWQKAYIREQGVDALVSTSPDNLAYTIGYVMPSLQLGVRKRRFAAVVTPDGPDVLLVVTCANTTSSRSRPRRCLPTSCASWG